jgi:hypothetical protein
LRSATQNLHGGAPHKESQPSSEIKPPHMSGFHFGPSVLSAFFLGKILTFLGSAKCNEKSYCFWEARHPFCIPENYHERSENFAKISNKNCVTAQP